MAGEKRFEIYSTSKSLIKILLLRIVEQVKKKKHADIILLAKLIVASYPTSSIY